MRIRKYTIQDIVDFVNKQKDDRGIDSHSSTGDAIGTVLMHFVRKKFKQKLIDVGCVKMGTMKIFIVPENGITDAFMRSFQFHMKHKSVSNYGDAKKLFSAPLVAKWMPNSMANITNV